MIEIKHACYSLVLSFKMIEGTEFDGQSIIRFQLNLERKFALNRKNKLRYDFRH